MFGYVYAPAVAVLPRRHDVPRAVKGLGGSIDARRAEIVARLEQIANARDRLGLSNVATRKLQKTFVTSYAKATSGYWRGGLCDAFWRCGSASRASGLLGFVGDQTTVSDARRLTPSARRFSRILEKLTEVLAHEHQALQTCIDVARSVEELGARPPSHVQGEWRSRLEVESEASALMATIDLHLDEVREALGQASKQVVPEKKHYGKRFWISSALYAVSVGIGIAALIASGGSFAAIIGIAALTFTTVIRLQSLASIRGFDRDRAWKSIEGLLADTRHFLESEGAMMKTQMNVQATRARLERDTMVWNQLNALSADLAKATQAQQARDAFVTNRLEGLSEDFAKEALARREDDAQVRRRLDGLSADLAKETRARQESEARVSHRLDGLSTGLEKATRAQEARDKQVWHRLDALSSDLKALAGTTGERFDRVEADVNRLTVLEADVASLKTTQAEGYARLSAGQDRLERMLKVTSDQVATLMADRGYVPPRSRSAGRAGPHVPRMA